MGEIPAASRSLAMRGTTAACIGLLAASGLSGCGEEPKPTIPLPDCYKAAQFGARSFSETPGSLPFAPLEEVSAQDKPVITKAIARTLRQASFKIIYDSGTKNARVATGFFLESPHEGKAYAITAGHAVADGNKTDLTKAVIVTEDEYSMQPLSGCLMAEDSGRKVDPSRKGTSDVDVAIMEVALDEYAKPHVQPLPLAAKPLEANEWVVIRTSRDTFRTKTLTDDNARVLAGMPDDALYHTSEYRIDPGDSGSLVASISKKGRIAVLGMATGAADYTHEAVDDPRFALQTVTVTPASAIAKAIEADGAL